MPNESWSYSRAEGDLLLHFSGGFDGTVEATCTIIGWFRACSIYAVLPTHPGPTDPVSADIVPRLRRMLNWGRFGSADDAARERQHWGGKHLGRHYQR